ncbi:class I mannose-6-phosphate isomerase [Paenibacillus arenilitoris]|uniref:Class I mannose-6-phosphate isomerase n=1 Tax=Paenibacillus arenilitoris TaxID=2772299 RepID=A0A927H8M1_9BACL|nr:class I mannose-6-phosphate isomerase [Paenibacillus arenilitoris]MBD2871833.1 class I mannose-6-phosphate isomerase [Paenibacillus arenilitoris]
MNTLYNKEPEIRINGKDREIWAGYASIAAELRRKSEGQAKTVLAIECYPGVRLREIEEGIRLHMPIEAVFHAEDAAIDAERREAKMSRYLTDDRVFGYMAPFTVDEFYDESKLERLRERIERVSHGLVVIIGFGASLAAEPDVLAYADLARWEIQQRYRSKENGNWLAGNADEDLLRKYKRGFFVEWRMADRLKQAVLPRADYYLDTNAKDRPVMATAGALFAGLEQAAAQPFRLVPYFDPGVWGGTWLEKHIGLEPKPHPYAWGFDGVPEENSLYFRYGDIRMELPALNLVFFQSAHLLGERVVERFGAEFPIRFDFLDTVGGQPLSLQVHPHKAYIREHFGMAYTQDESYYMLEAEDDAVVYLGLKEGIDAERMIGDLEKAQQGGFTFPAERYVNAYPAKKHDHFLIPAGTVHCSGTNGMVLEISATPYIFTFKLWDWDRLGLDGKPRPVHLEHGRKNISWERTTAWVNDNLVDRVEPLGEGDGWTEERTGLHELEFIETRRHWFTGKVPHHTQGTFHMLNLVEGDEAVVESPEGKFEPFAVRYAETFIIPASVGAYTIKPGSGSRSGRLATIKAYVRS